MPRNMGFNKTYIYIYIITCGNIVAEYSLFFFLFSDFGEILHTRKHLISSSF
jgi:hypothetical protein